MFAIGAHFCEKMALSSRAAISNDSQRVTKKQEVSKMTNLLTSCKMKQPAAGDVAAAGAG